MRKRTTKKTILLLAMAMLFALTMGSSCVPSANTPRALSYLAYDGQVLDAITITVVDVGHGDCIILQSESGQTMMIDTGPIDQREALVQVMEDLSIDEIDILLLTHPHSDHIGNAQWLLENVPVHQLHMGLGQSTSPMYQRLIAYIEDDWEVLATQSGISFAFAGIQFSYIGPLQLQYDDLNDTSAVLYGVYGSTTMLFTGDMLTTAEHDIANAYTTLPVDFLKVGHHAYNSCSEQFLSLIQPSVSVISMGDIDSYEDADVQQRAIIERLSAYGDVYRTDTGGTLAFVCDGVSIAPAN